MQSLTSIIRQSLMPKLATIQKESSLKWLKKHLPSETGVNGLHAFCGSGQETFLIGSLLNGAFNLYGIDENQSLIKKAEAAKDVGQWKQIYFLNTNPSTWESEQKFDFVYSRIWKTDLWQQASFLKNTKNNLEKGGKFILELIQFSGFSAYPYHPVYSRSVELIAKIEQSHANNTEKCIDLLQNLGFQIQEINYSPPAFITKMNKDFLSRILATFEEKLLQLRLVTKEELEPLLLELQRYEARADTLISRPGVYQILAST